MNPKIAEQEISDWLKKNKISSSKSVPAVEGIDQVIGQSYAKKAIDILVRRKRSVFFVGNPGVGKSLLLKEAVKRMPDVELRDIVGYVDSSDPKTVKFLSFPGGEAKYFTRYSTIDEDFARGNQGNRRSRIDSPELREIIEKESETKEYGAVGRILFIVFSVLVGVILAWIIFSYFSGVTSIFRTTILFIALAVITAICIFFLLFYPFFLRFSGTGSHPIINPYVILHENRTRKGKTPVLSVSSSPGSLGGSFAWAPYGIWTPADEKEKLVRRPTAAELAQLGQIHKVNGGYIFIDEIKTFSVELQIAFLETLEEKKSRIGQISGSLSGGSKNHDNHSQLSSFPLSTTFEIACAGNLDSLDGLHPAFLSRLLARGSIVFMEDTMEDNDANRFAVLQYFSQEIKSYFEHVSQINTEYTSRDVLKKEEGYDMEIYEPISHIDEERIELNKQKREEPSSEKTGFQDYHFDIESLTILMVALSRFSEVPGNFSLHLRDFSGIIRTAIDLQIMNNPLSTKITKETIILAILLQKPLSKQIGDYVQDLVYYERTKQLAVNESKVGIVSAIAVRQLSQGALVAIPQYVEVIYNPEASTNPHTSITFVAQNVEKGWTDSLNIALTFMSLIFKDILRNQFIVHFATGSKLDGNSATLAMFLACLSSYYQIPLDNSYSITGALDLKGNVRPIGGVSAKASGTFRWGYKGIIYPIDNDEEIQLLDKKDFIYNSEDSTNSSKFDFQPVYTILDAIKLAFPEGEKRDQIIKTVEPFVEPSYLELQIPSKRLG